VVFVADALGTWLVEQLADAGRKKLTELMLGSEQERALRRAADAALWATAEEVSPSGDEQAGQIAMVVSEVFRDPVPDAPLVGPVMLLEGLQAGIAGQLAVLDDVELTGAGQSSADVLGVPGTVLADMLTGHLVREIIFRGSGGGPLTPLADQLNHELTRLQGQRIEGMFARLAGEVRDALARPDSDVTVAGWPLQEMTDPFVLEVHRPVQPEDAPPGLPLLPPYVPREHDQVLGQVARAAADGRSGIAVLVGGSSTGKTRACWETLALLRDQNPPWRLWHPIDPSRPDAALRELPGIGPRTVVWLNEAQFYLDADAGLGERVAAGLRELLRDPGRAPVLVLATVWPRFWDVLTARPVGGDDWHAQARELLAGHDITVPAAFTPAQVSHLTRAADMRMILAARSAPDGEVIQFLAGVPELLARYRNASSAAKALIHAAMDARRLGMGAGLPQAFLEAAALGYLTDAEWDELGEDWLEQALAYTAVPCKGARGPLTRIRPRPASRIARNRRDQPGSMATAAGPLYRLADYLDQHGRAHRASQVPPAEFWSAAATHAAPGDQAALGDAAHARGLYRDAAQLHKNAAASGNPRAVSYLGRPPACLRADPGPAHWAAVHAVLDNPYHVASLLARLRQAGGHEQAAALLARDPAAHAPLDDPGAVASLLTRLRQAGADEQAAALADQAAGHAPLDDPLGVDILLAVLQKAGADEQAAVLADRAAAHAPLDDPGRVASLLTRLQEAGADEQAAALADRAAAHVSLEDPGGVASLLTRLRQAGADEQAAALLARDPAGHVSLEDPGGVASLLTRLRQAGADEQAAVLLARDPAAHAPLDDPLGVDILLAALQEAGGYEQASALADRAAAHAPLDDPGRVASLLTRLQEAGADEQAAVLADRAAAHAPLDDPGRVASLLTRLQEAGRYEQAAALADRAAAHVSLEDPGGVASLLARLRQAGGYEQAAALLARDPAGHVSLEDPGGVASLLTRLRQAGADELADRRDAARVLLDDPHRVASLQIRLRQAGAREQAAALADRAAAHAPLDDPGRVASLLTRLQEAGAREQTAALLARDPAAHASLDDPGAVALLLGSLRQAGADEQAAALLARDPAAHASLDDPGAVALLLTRLRQAGADEQAAMLLARDPAAHASLDDPGAVALLLTRLRQAGADEQAAALADRAAAAHALLDDPWGVASLLTRLRQAGADEQAAALADRAAAAHALLEDLGAASLLLGSLGQTGGHEQTAALLARDPAAHVSLNDPWGVASLLARLREASADEQAAALADRAAAHAPLDDPGRVASLLAALQKTGAHKQAAALADWAAAHAPLDDPGRVASLLAALQKTGAHKQAATLAGRLPPVGMFGLFLEQNGHADRFSFGREVDGTPAAPWGWEDLDLWLVPRRQGQAAPAQH